MTSTNDRSLAVRLLIVFGVAATAAALTGGLLGAAVYALVMAGASPDDPWAELGAAIFGLAAGLLVGGAVYVAAVIRGVRRECPRGERVWPAVVLLAAPFGVYFLGGLISLAAGG